jgi:hypothetical protein
MSELLANGQVKKNDGTIVTPANGEWIDGRRMLNGQLLAPNEYEPGKFTSAAVNNQSAAAQGVSPDQFNTYLQSQTQKVNGDLAAAGLGGGDTSGGGSGSGSSIGSTGPINLQNIYDQAYASAGITGLQDKYKTLQDQLTTKEQALANAKADINENPFYSEGNRTGVISKLDQAAQNDMNVLIKQQAVLQDQINSAKTDVDTKLNIATKQFDINSSASTQALSQFNTLLSAGALDNASAADINQFAAATGISTSMINSAVKLSKQKNTESKMIETTDDSGNVTVSLVQIKDGQMAVVSKQSLGNIGKTSGSTTSLSALKVQAIGDATAILDSVKNEYGHVTPQDWAAVRSAALQSGMTASDFNSNFSSYTDPNRTDFNSAYGFAPSARGANQYQILNQGS